MDEYIHPMDRRDPNWLSAAEEARQELNEHLERRSVDTRTACATCGDFYTLSTTQWHPGWLCDTCRP